MKNRYNRQSLARIYSLAPVLRGEGRVVGHTIQIGKEKALVVLRMPEGRPRDAGPLQQGKREVLAIEPRASWKREDVLEVYGALAKQYGAPRAIASDTPELQEPIAMLGERRDEILAKTERENGPPSHSPPRPQALPGQPTRSGPVSTWGEG